jgi:hypothetical protein
MEEVVMVAKGCVAALVVQLAVSSCHNETYESPEYAAAKTYPANSSKLPEWDRINDQLRQWEIENEIRRQKDEAYIAACHDKYNPAGYNYPLESTSNHLGCLGSKRCIAVPIVVQYLLEESNEEMKWIVVEAFDNPLFLGEAVHRSVSPASVDLIAQAKVNTALHIAQGRYYLRAFTAKQEFGANLALGPGSAVGFYSEISRPVQYVVDFVNLYPQPCPGIAQINITEQFPDEND